MATVRKIMIDPLPPPLPAKIPVYATELSPDEAKALLAVLVRVGGRPNTPRRHIDAIINALRSAGAPELASYVGVFDSEFSLHFKG